MQSPFSRLRHAIDKISITYDTSNYMPKVNYQTNENLTQNIHSHQIQQSYEEQKEKKQVSLDRYYTQDQFNKMLKLIESQKQKFQHQNQINLNSIRQLKHQIQNLNEQQIKILRECQTLKGDLVDSINQNKKLILSVKTASDKQKILKSQNERLIETLEDLNKQINTLRSKNKLLQSNIKQANYEQLKTQQMMKLNQQKLKKQIEDLKSQIGSRKKIIDFNIQSNVRQLQTLRAQYQDNLRIKSQEILSLQQKIEHLTQLISGQKQKYTSLNKTIYDYEHTISQLQNNIVIRQQKIQNLNTELNQNKKMLHQKQALIQAAEERSQQLQILLQEEKANQKYHIVEVVDQMKDKQLEAAKIQVKELFKEKIILQQKLKRACICKSRQTNTKSTLQELNNNKNSESFLNVHEIKLIKKQ